MNPFAFISHLVFEPDYDHDADFSHERSWAKHVDVDEHQHPRLLLDHALRQYELTANAQSRIDDKIEAIVKLSAGHGTLLIAFSGIAKPNLSSWWIVAAFAFLLVACVIGIFARRAILLPRPPSIRDVLEGTLTAHSPEAWLATSLHISVAKMVVAINWSARQLFDIQLLVAAALLCLVTLNLSQTT